MDSDWCRECSSWPLPSLPSSSPSFFIQRRPCAVDRILKSSYYLLVIKGDQADDHPYLHDVMIYLYIYMYMSVSVALPRMPLRKDFGWRMKSHSPPSFLLHVEISSCASVTPLGRGSVHKDSASWDNCGLKSWDDCGSLTKCMWADFPCFPHCQDSIVHVLQ